MIKVIRYTGSVKEVIEFSTVDELIEFDKKKGDDCEDVLINSLDLSVRAKNILSNAGIKTIKDLSAVTILDIYKLPGAGKKTVDEIKGCGIPFRG